MNVFSALNAISQFSERVNASPVTLNNAICLHSQHKDAACSACAAICPTGALHIDDDQLVTLDSEHCVGCAACTYTCPVGAIHGATRADRLLRHVKEHGAAVRIELVCPYRETIIQQADGSAAAFVTPHCLAALAPSTYVELANRGVRHITLRLDACAACPISAAAAVIVQTATASAELLGGAPTTQITLVTNPPANRRAIPELHDTRQNTVSRRGLFQRFARQFTETTVNLPPVDIPATLTPEQQRLLPALAERASQTGELPPWAPTLAADVTCTGCGTCAKLCPLDALSFERDDDRFRLYFRAAYCAGCNLCVVGCPEQALHLMPELQPADPATVSPETLVEGGLQTCQRCRTAFHSASGETLCPACAFRRKNPFGSRLVNNGV